MLEILQYPGAWSSRSLVKCYKIIVTIRPRNTLTNRGFAVFSQGNFRFIAANTVGGGGLSRSCANFPFGFYHESSRFRREITPTATSPRDCNAPRLSGRFPASESR